jgi:hypothetical protein
MHPIPAMSCQMVMCPSARRMSTKKYWVRNEGLIRQVARSWRTVQTTIRVPHRLRSFIARRGEARPSTAHLLGNNMFGEWRARLPALHAIYAGLGGRRAFAVSHPSAKNAEGWGTRRNKAR